MSRSVPFAAALFATVLVSDRAWAQVCVEEVRSDYINWTWDPARPHSGRNGQVSALAEDWGGREDDEDQLFTSVVLPLTVPTHSLQAVVDWSVISGHANTDLFGYGEAGVEVRMEAQSSTGTVLCSSSRTLAKVQGGFASQHLSPGPQTPLTCSLSRDHSGPVIIEVTAHAWVDIGGIGTAGAALDLQVVDLAVKSCTGACGSSCAPVTTNGRTCYCDDACSELGDCCANVAEVCEQDSCWEMCGGPSANGTCFCDDLCTLMGDCCADFDVC